MSAHHIYEYRAYLWTLSALVVVFFGAMILSAIFPGLVSKIEAFGLGTITGGLIGLLRMPRHAPQPDDAPEPVKIEDL